MYSDTDTKLRVNIKRTSSGESKYCYHTDTNLLAKYNRELTFKNILHLVAWAYMKILQIHAVVAHKFPEVKLDFFLRNIATFWLEIS